MIELTKINFFWWLDGRRGIDYDKPPHIWSGSQEVFLIGRIFYYKWADGPPGGREMRQNFTIDLHFNSCGNDPILLNDLIPTLHS